MKKNYFNILKNSKSSKIFIVSMMVGFFILAVFLFESYSSYMREIDNAKVQSSNLTVVLEEQIGASFKKIDLTLQEFQDQFSKEQTLNVKNSSAYNNLLLIHKKRLPEVLSFKVVDQNGEFIGDDSGVLFKGNLRDRDYFQYLKNSEKDELKISKPVMSKTHHVWVLVLSRAILSKEGKFRGLILATIPIDHYRKIFSALNVGEKGVITLYGFDNYIYARIPWSEDHYGKMIKLSPQIDELIMNENQFITYPSSSRVDGYKRILTARKVGNYNLIVVVGIAFKDFLYAWKIRTFVYVFLVIILFSGFAFFLLNFLYSQELVEEQRKQAIQSAKLASLGEMAGGIAHEINNPLTIISSTCAFLKKLISKDKMDPVIMTKGLDDIEKTITRIAKIIQGLRTVSRDTTREGEEFISVQLRDLMDDVVGLCSEKFKNHGVNFIIDLSDPVYDSFIECRRIQISQIFLNLLGNAYDAIENLPEKWIKIECYYLTNNIEFRISDSGQGIPKDIQEKIFQPFFTTKPVGKGTGLGLSLSVSIVKDHNGTFTIDSGNSNTCFVISLPVVKIAA